MHISLLKSGEKGESLFLKPITFYLRAFISFAIELKRKYIKKKVIFSEWRIEDIPELLNLYKEDGTEIDDSTILAKSLTSLKDWGFCLIAKYKSKVIGSVVIRRFPDEILYYRDWWVFVLLVAKKYRNLGIGKSLMKEAMEKAKSNGAKEVKLMVNFNASPAINLYKKLGFSKISIPGLDEELAKNEIKHNREYLLMGFKI